MDSLPMFQVNKRLSRKTSFQSKLEKNIVWHLDPMAFSSPVNIMVLGCFFFGPRLCLGPKNTIPSPRRCLGLRKQPRTILFTGLENAILDPGAIIYYFMLFGVKQPQTHKNWEKTVFKSLLRGWSKTFRYSCATLYSSLSRP